MSSNYRDGILDNEAYGFSRILDIPDLTAQQKLTLGVTTYDHAMCITGALTKNNIAEQFRVDNSFGQRGKYGGQMLMTSSFLENSVITLVINRKFLM